MNIDLMSMDARKSLIKDIKGDENRQRKLEAYRRFEVKKGKIRKHVVAYLRDQLGAEDIVGMPIVSSINIADRVINQESSVYSGAPARVFTDLIDSDLVALQAVYEDGKFNAKCQRANEVFKLNKGQAVVQPILKGGKVELRVLYAHQFDVIPDANDPEKAFGYVLSNFDRTSLVRSDGMNQAIADVDDNRALSERYTVWTEQLNFTMDGKGNILSEEIINPLEMIPFVDIAEEKDGDFFVMSSEADTDFTIQYNAALSDLQNIVRLQGYAQAVYTGSADMMPKVVRLGPTRVLKLMVDPNNPGVPADFKYVNANPDIEGSLKAIDQLIANFLTTRGVDTKAIAGSLSSESTYASGTERLLAMIERFEASREDFSTFKCAELQIFEVVKAWLAKYSNTEFLDQKYWVTPSVMTSAMSINFAKPESIKSDAELYEELKLRMDMGIADKVTALMEAKGMTEEQALEELGRQKAREAVAAPPAPEPQFGRFGGAA